MLLNAYIENFSSVTKRDRLNAMCDMREKTEKKKKIINFPFSFI